MNFVKHLCVFPDINGNEYKLYSAKAAVDTAFKSLYVLQLEYQHEAELVWIFLQITIYDISTLSKL